MHIDCPHCQNPIDIVLDQPTDPITCPSCGSSVSLFDPEKTISHRETVVKQLGQFRFIDHLGSGQFGDVWLAYDSTLDRQVALKVPRKEDLSAADVEMFMREARSGAQLKHPNIVHLYEVGKSGKLVFIVSEYIRGTTLSEWMAVYKPNHDQAARLCATLAVALHHAHEAGVVHRDMKPSNVLMDQTGEPHITDFGLAKRDGADITMTVDGQILGTPAYMPPEQARGDGHNADRRSDVYSLGVMLFEMLTGERPFKSTTKRTMIHQVLNDEPPKPRRIRASIPRDLETICLAAISKDPARRYQTALAMADDLRRYIKGLPIVARPITRIERARKWAMRNPLVATLSMVCTILALALCGALVITPPPFPQTIELTTAPPGANVYFIPIDRDIGLPDPSRLVDAGKSPVSVNLLPGDYFVVADLGVNGFHEVLRHVPDEDEFLPEMYSHLTWTRKEESQTIILEPIEIFPTDWADTHEMAQFGGASHFEMGSPTIPDAPLHVRFVPPFYLDTTELNVGKFRINRNGEKRTFPEQIRNGELEDNEPLPWLTYDQAVQVAESMGMRVQDETEYEFAATDSGRTEFPSGQAPDAWPYGPAGTPESDQIRAANGRLVFGLYSNLAEWTANKFAPYPTLPNRDFVKQFTSGEYAIFRGGPNSVATGNPDRQQFQIGPRIRIADERRKAKPRLGVRMARSVKPRTTPEDFIRILND